MLGLGGEHKGESRRHANDQWSADGARVGNGQANRNGTAAGNKRAADSIKSNGR